MRNNFYIVIVAGGSGTRLWPVSRENSPKQFHKLTSDKSLLEETYDRIKDLTESENIYISLGANAALQTKAQLKEIPEANYIIEPEGKNTAPAIALISAKIFKKDPQAIIATIAADHTVKNNSNYTETLKSAAHFVDKNPEYLVTIGIQPDSAHTGYGYVKIGRKLDNEKAHEVEEFVEKPNLETAQKYFDSGKYLWNAGYFIFRADKMIEMFENYAPEIYSGLRAILKAIGTEDEKEIIEKAFKEFPKVPIDTAIAEKVEKIAVIPADLGWSDIGSWSSVFDLLDKEDGNVHRGHHVGIDDKNCLFFAQDKLLATVGLEDIVVVDTPDVTLICKKDKAQEVKKLIEKLKEQGKHKYL
ncbi:TPA: mannose-1-phosphate guanylyltransferase [Candidatus Berkelbacteria bacterium]|uniref:mannose-1-phosphate guanylyltransferase n=1 Tax=Berkelbacteria bacterium GW2011_GWE1_39_12 TaxID=1618337 RepID=A0A0G4B2Q5_9BACT|nr:MAG: mannose-1-phosphate guanylyltransferase/mannose-6-phosphate isomerase, mannose-1-phosphate guanylyltransferase [Berkelbacteria bacterium GW2011_GWE1_39_12]HBO60098.1 mannose-1-phosphate guanylyltransferase [Candidatus Berkelbacteria bacterium]